jgi:DNA-binding GntR family transcriptional regulator
MTHAPVPFDLTLAREAFENSSRLHREATLRGATNLTPGDFERLREADSAFVTALKEGRVEDAIHADDAFHRVLVDAAGDPDLAVSVDLLLPRLHRMDLWVFTRKAFSEAPNTHPEIIAALEAGDAETAARLVEESHAKAGEQLAAAVERGARTTI